MIEFLEFSYGSPWYDRVLPFRNRVLREPLGLRFTAEERGAERAQRHFALVDGEMPIACLIAALRGGGRFQLRQMAVAEDRREQGLGRQLIERVESLLLRQGATELMLHARADVTGFYEKLGYVKTGGVFIEVTIPHQEMVKRIS